MNEASTNFVDVQPTKFSNRSYFLKKSTKIVSGFHDLHLYSLTFLFIWTLFTLFAFHLNLVYKMELQTFIEFKRGSEIESLGKVLDWRNYVSLASNEAFHEMALYLPYYLTCLVWVGVIVECYDMLFCGIRLSTISTCYLRLKLLLVNNHLKLTTF